jgi:hypothetical protein
MFSGYAHIFLTAIKMILKAILLNPFGILLTSVVVAFAAIFKYFGGFDKWLALMKDGLVLIGYEIKSFASAIWDGLGAAFKWLMEVMNPVFELFKSIGSAIADFFKPAIDLALKALQPLFDMLSKLSEMVEKVFNPGGAVAKMVHGEIKSDDQLKEEALKNQRSAMLKKRERGEISDVQYKAFMKSSYAANPVQPQAQAAATPASGSFLGPPAMEGIPMAPGGVQKTEHTEVQKQDVTLTLNLPPGATLSGTTGPVPNNVHVGGRAAALGGANG